MLTSVHVYNEDGGMIELPLDGIDSQSNMSQYVITDIDGLGPVKANILTSSYATMDGGAYLGSRGNMRNIVFYLEFDPDYSVSDDPIGGLRRALYPYFAPKKRVELHFFSTHMETVKIVGYVESFEPMIFSKEPQMQVSVLCPNPYFSSLSMIVESRINSGTITINNPGDVAYGFEMRFAPISTPAGTWDEIVIDRVSPQPDSMAYQGPMYVQGEQLVISIITIKGSKSAKWAFYSGYNPDPNVPVSGGDVLGYVVNWLELQRGINTFDFTLPIGLTLPCTISMIFTPKYLGL